MPHTAIESHRTPLVTECESGLAPRINGSAPDAGSPHDTLRGKRAIVVMYSVYPGDARPRRAAEALVRQGMEVELICLRESKELPRRETANGIRVLRLPITRHRRGILTYLWQYGSFTLTAFVVLTVRSLRRRYDFVHVHNMPDVLVFSAVVPRLLGSKIVLDLHDPMPELMTTIYGLGEQSWSVRFLKFLECRSIAFAHGVITVNLACQKIFGARTSDPQKIEVVMNSPDERIFRFRAVDALPRSSGRFAIMYHGSIVERNGLDLAVEALAMIRSVIAGAELRIYGDGNAFLDQVLKRADQLGLTGVVHHLGALNHEGIARAIDDCDVGIVPNRRNTFTEINTPTRIFEYLSRGKAVIAPAAHGITDYFKPDELVFFKLGDVSDLARQLVHVASHPASVAVTVKRGQDIYLSHQWSRERDRMLGLFAKLLTPENSRHRRGHCTQ